MKESNTVHWYREQTSTTCVLPSAYALHISSSHIQQHRAVRRGERHRARLPTLVVRRNPRDLTMQHAVADRLDLDVALTVAASGVLDVGRAYERGLEVRRRKVEIAFVRGVQRRAHGQIRCARVQVQDGVRWGLVCDNLDGAVGGVCGEVERAAGLRACGGDEGEISVDRARNARLAGGMRGSEEWMAYPFVVANDTDVALPFFSSLLAMTEILMGALVVWRTRCEDVLNLP